MERTVFVSPHLDDAVFSCPGRLLEAARAGQAPVVFTVFTRDAAGDQERRLGENREAARLGGFEAVEGGFLDAPFREHPHRDFLSIIFGNGPRDDLLAAEIAEQLALIVDREAATTLLGPLGVGRHVDHRIAHRACRIVSEARPGLRALFYEDRPYSFVDQAVEMRLAELGFDSEPELGKFEASLFEARYVRAHLKRRDHEQCRSLYKATLPDARPAGAPPGGETALFGDLEAVWTLVSAYESQLGPFVGGREEFFAACGEASSRRHAAASYAERLWPLPGRQYP